jgi:hypothetical protein
MIKVGSRIGVLCGAAILIAAGPAVSGPASTGFLIRIQPPRYQSIPVAKPAPLRIKLPAPDSFGSRRTLGADYAPPAKWSAQKRPGKMDYDLPGVGAAGALGLHPEAGSSLEASPSNSLLASTVPNPTNSLFSGAPDVTVGASVNRPF